MDHGRRKMGVRVLGLLGGVVLLALALWQGARQVDMATLARAGVGAWVGIGLLVTANLGVTGALFWVVTLSFDVHPPVRLGRMIRLIAASAVVNYLPLGWPGPVVRSAYLKARHGMPVRQSMLVLLVVLAMSAVLAVAAVAAMVLAERLAMPSSVALGWVGAVVVIGAAVTGPAAGALLRRKVVRGWAWLPLKALDMAVGAARLWWAFRVVGQPITPVQALALAGVDMVVSMVSLTPSGLGVSEWAVGLLAQVLSIAQGPVGLAAKLVDRGVSVVVTVAAGLVALPGLRR